jgi:ABC-type antimicrobial peptide transport system permease subunit
MKSFSIRNIYDIGVYRAIGINKASIVFVYAIEIFIISLRTILIGTTLCFFVANFITSIPLIDASFAIDLSIYIITTVGLIILNVIVGVLPVISCLRLTPSKILTRYDV